MSFINDMAFIEELTLQPADFEVSQNLSRFCKDRINNGCYLARYVSFIHCLIIMGYC